MIKLVINNKDEYCNYVLEGNNSRYEININFMGIDEPKVGDYIYIPERVLKEKISLNYGKIEDNNVKEEELMLLIRDNDKIYLQRFYG